MEHQHLGIGTMSYTYYTKHFCKFLGRKKEDKNNPLEMR